MYRYSISLVRGLGVVFIHLAKFYHVVETSLVRTQQLLKPLL